MHIGEQAGLEEFILRSLSFPLYEHTCSFAGFAFLFPHHQSIPIPL